MNITNLTLTGSIIFLVLGTIHLVYTFFSRKFFPADRSVVTAMEETNPLISKETSMWKAWIGFNASHSLGAIYFAIVNIIAVLYAKHLYIQYIGLPFLNMIFSLAYLLLAAKYWFKIPFTGILLSTICFSLAFFLRRWYFFS